MSGVLSVPFHPPTVSSQVSYMWKPGEDPRAGRVRTPLPSPPPNTSYPLIGAYLPVYNGNPYYFLGDDGKICSAGPPISAIAGTENDNAVSTIHQLCSSNGIPYCPDRTYESYFENTEENDVEPLTLILEKLRNMMLFPPIMLVGPNSNLFFDPITRLAYFTLHRLSGETLKGKRTANRKLWNRFYRHSLLPTFMQPKKEDFGGRWSQGHSMPAGDFMDQFSLMLSFAFPNIYPQDLIMNKKGWRRLEKEILKEAKNSKTTYVLNGALLGYYDSNGRVQQIPPFETSGPNHLPVPHSFYKLVVFKKKDNSLTVKLYVMKNEPIPYNINIEDYQEGETAVIVEPTRVMKVLSDFLWGMGFKIDAETYEIVPINLWEATVGASIDECISDEDESEEDEWDKDEYEEDYNFYEDEYDEDYEDDYFYEDEYDKDYENYNFDEDEYDKDYTNDEISEKAQYRLPKSCGISFISNVRYIKNSFLNR